MRSLHLCLVQFLRLQTINQIEIWFPKNQHESPFGSFSEIVRSGYYLSGGRCLAQACQPTQSYGSVDCKSEISYSSAASKTKTCNGSGSDYLFGLCTATSCAPGYYLNNNSCVAQTCSPNQALGDVDCKSEISFAAEASKAKSCNTVGNDYTYGACNLKSCGPGYFKSGNSCVAQKCTPNQKLTNVSCTSEISNSLTAEMTRTCNNDGSDFIYGSCAAETCAWGNELFNGICRSSSKVVSNPTALPYGWYDVTKDSSGNYVRCDVTRLKSCAYQLNLNGPVFSGYDGVRKTWAEADAQCKLLGYRLPTDKELIGVKFLLASVQELEGPSWPSEWFFWSGTLSADKVYATRVWLPGNDPRQVKISDSWNRNQVLCVAATSPTTLTDSPSSPGGSTSSSIASSTVSVAGLTYTLSGPSIAKVDQCVALTLKRNSPTSAALALLPGLKSGEGGVFTDSSCSRASWSGISIPAGSSAVTFYFKNWSTGSTTIDLTSLSTGDSFGEHAISVQK